MESVDSRGGPALATLTTPKYTAPDPALVRETEKLILSSYLLGIDHAASPLDLADDGDYAAIPFDEAVKFMKSRVPLTKAEWSALEEQVRFRAFTVAALSAPDAIERIRKHVIVAVENGTSLSKFWTAAKAEDVAGLGSSPWYWETVYRTNVQTAYNAGRATQIMKSNPEYLEFIGIEDSRQTAICAQRNGVVLPATHPFWKSNWPPLHFNCRSTVRAVFKGEADALRAQNNSWKPTDDEELRGISGSRDGFGGNPIKTGSFYMLTPQMIQRAEEYGLIGDIKEFAKELGLKSYRIKGISQAAKISSSSMPVTTEKEPKDTVPIFKKTSDAEVWVIESKLADSCSFKGFDIDVVQELVEGLKEDMEKYPKARSSMQFFGSIKERNSRIRTWWIKERVPTYTAVGFDEKKAAVLARKEIDGMLRKNGYIPKPGSIAQYSPMKGFKGVSINDKYATDYNSFRALVERDMQSGHFPQGTGTITAVARHEMGHALDDVTGLSSDGALLSYWESLSKDDIRFGLSGYATNSVQEFIAESWSEYTVSPNPRSISRKVGEMLVARLNRS